MTSCKSILRLDKLIKTGISSSHFLSCDKIIVKRNRTCDIEDCDRACPVTAVLLSLITVTKSLILHLIPLIS